MPDLASGGRQPPDGRAALLAAGLLGGFALLQATAANNFQDLFVYRAGTALALRGESPYDLAAIRAAVAEQFPDPDPSPTSFVNNCGFFLPPAAVLLFALFAAVPWPVAKVLWAGVMAAAGYGVARLAEHRPGGRCHHNHVSVAPASRPVLRLALPLVFLLNPLTLAGVVVGQSTVLFVGCVSAGLWCFDRGRPTLGAVLWAVPFVKPHLALPLLPLAWYLGGWRRAAALAAAVGLLNLVGATVAGGSPLFLRDYLDFLATGHQAVVYNRAELNPQVTSWNRLLFALGGPLFELTATTTLIGYAVWFGLVAGRCRLSGRPSAAWAAAVAAVGGVLCAQVLGYELLTLALVLPWVRELFADGLRAWGWAAAGLLAVQLVPAEVFAAAGVGVHRPLGVALLAAIVLAGPVTRNASTPASGSSHRRG